MTVADAWEQYADEWVAWADPAHADGFWTSTWPTLAQVLPPPDGLVVDLGCGEGRGLRELRRHGYDAVGFDRSPTLVRAAAGHSPDAPVVIADATSLPVRDGCAALVFAAMALQDLDDLDAALAEVRRVLRPGGVLCAAIVHPFMSACDPESMYRGTVQPAGPYLVSRRYVDRASRNGRSMTFTSIHHPLHAYLDPLFRLGFVLTAVREEGDGVIPWLLAFRAARTVDADAPLRGSPPLT